MAYNGLPRRHFVLGDDVGGFLLSSDQWLVVRTRKSCSSHDLFRLLPSRTVIRRWAAESTGVADCIPAVLYVVLSIIALLTHCNKARYKTNVTDGFVNIFGWDMDFPKPS